MRAEVSPGPATGILHGRRCRRRRGPARAGLTRPARRTLPDSHTPELPPRSVLRSRRLPSPTPLARAASRRRAASASRVPLRRARRSGVGRRRRPPRTARGSIEPQTDAVPRPWSARPPARAPGAPAHLTGLRPPFLCHVDDPCTSRAYIALTSAPSTSSPPIVATGRQPAQSQTSQAQRSCPRPRTTTRADRNAGQDLVLCPRRQLPGRNRGMRGVLSLDLYELTTATSHLRRGMTGRPRSACSCAGCLPSAGSSSALG
jgi:hypothetical protein